MTAVADLWVGPLRLDPPNEGLRRGTEMLRLTRKAFAALHYLATHPGRVVTNEDSESRPQAPGLLGPAPWQGALKALLSIRRFLLLDVLLHTLELEPDRGYCIAARPEVLTCEISLLLLHSSSNNQSTLSFQKSNHRRHGMLGWNLNTHMDVIRQQVPLNNATLFLAGQVVKYLSQHPPQFSIHRFASVPRHRDRL